MIFIIGLIFTLLMTLVLKILKVSLSLIKKLAINGIIGVVLLFFANVLGPHLGLPVLKNSIFNAMVAGVFGIPGVLILYILNS